MFVVALFMVCVLFGVESYANPSNERIIEGDFRRLMNAIAHNETETFAKFIEAIKKSAQRSEENFNSTKDEVRWIQENRTSRQHLSVGGRHAATFKRDSGVQPVEQGSKQTVVLRTLKMLGYEKSWSEMDDYDRAMAFTSLAEKYTAALEDAGFSEFLLHIRSKSEVFEDQMMVHTGFYGDPQYKKTEYESLIWKKLEGRDPPKAGETAQLPPELSNGTHYRKLILILHFADERVSMQLKLLKDLLGRTREGYHRYAMAHQRLYGIWSRDPHSKLLNLKYVKRDTLDYYISLLSEELQSGVEVFVLSELTGGIGTTTVASAVA